MDEVACNIWMWQSDEDDDEDGWHRKKVSEFVSIQNNFIQCQIQTKALSITTAH